MCGENQLAGRSPEDRQTRKPHRVGAGIGNGWCEAVDSGAEGAEIAARILWVLTGNVGRDVIAQRNRLPDRFAQLLEDGVDRVVVGPSARPISHDCECQKYGHASPQKRTCPPFYFPRRPTRMHHWPRRAGSSSVREDTIAR